ncbi:MAG: hypothetical protein J5U17_01750 [Candidatus Methanoperedens sp.]|nr:hypothetical protein [Candidatus Methanoperedens sp.]
MSLKETYFGNLENVKKMDPGAVIIDVTCRAGSVLSPSWDMLNEYKAGKMTWDEYVSGFMREMDNPECKTEMLRIGEIAMTKEVYLVCFEGAGNCHRFLLVDMIKYYKVSLHDRRDRDKGHYHPLPIRKGFGVQGDQEF